MSPLIVRFADLSVHVQDPEFSLKYVRESTMRSHLYVVRRSQRLPESASADKIRFLTELFTYVSSSFFVSLFLVKCKQIIRVRCLYVINEQELELRVDSW